MKIRPTLFLVTLIFVTWTHLANSHHSAAPVFDLSRTVTIEGIVSQFRLVNPHAKMTIKVKDGTDNQVTWTMVMAGVLSLSRRGWTTDTVSIGERVTVTGHPTHSGSPMMFFVRLVLADGTELLAPRPEASSIIDEQRRQRARERAQKK